MSIPPGDAAPEMAAVKGGTRMMPALLNAQYTYVLGVDGVVDKKTASTRQVTPGKRRLLFACSHYAGLMSVAETTLTLEANKRYLVEADDFKGCRYIVYEMPGRKEIARSAPRVYGSDTRSQKEYFDDVYAHMGWRKEE